MADDRSQRTRRRPRRSAMPRRMVEMLVEADQSPEELADALGLTLEELSAVARNEGIVETVRSLAQLSDVRAQMLLSRFRAHAAMHLAQIATAKEPSELSRKACVDLLKADLRVFADAGASSPAEGKQPSPPSHDELLVILEQLGREAT